MFQRIVINSTAGTTMVYNSPAELAHLCRDLRTRKGLTQQELADAVGENTKQAVSNAETATDSSRLKIQRKILGHFGKSVETVYRVENG